MTTEAQADKSANPRQLEFYDVDPSRMDSTARQVLHEYSGIPSIEIDGHVESIVSCPYVQSLVLAYLSLEETSFRNREISFYAR
jgi:hypothetical protein